MMLVGYIRTAQEIRDHPGHTHLADLLLAYFIVTEILSPFLELVGTVVGTIYAHSYYFL